MENLPEPQKNDPKKPLFTQYSPNRLNQRIGYSAIKFSLRRAAKLSGIKRPVRPHDLRHTSATDLLRDPSYTTSEIKAMGGWSSLQMLVRYGHVTSHDVAEKRRKNGNGEKIDYEKPIRPVSCPRCNKDTPSDFKHCIHCGLSRDQFKKEAEENFMKLLLPELMKDKMELIKVAKEKARENKKRQESLWTIERLNE